MMPDLLGSVGNVTTGILEPAFSSPLLFLFIMAVGSALTGGFPSISSASFEFSLNRVFILTMFFLHPSPPVFYFALASVAAGAAVRRKQPGSVFRRYLISSGVVVLLLEFIPDLAASLMEDTTHQLLLLYTLCVIVAVETIINCLTGSKGSDLKYLASRALLVYMAVIPLVMMTVVMTSHAGIWGAGLSTMGLVGFSFIGRSINRKHERNTARIAQITRQDRLALKLIDSSSYPEYLETLETGLFSEPDSRAYALVRKEQDDEWSLWSSKGKVSDSVRPDKRTIPARTEFRRNFRAGDLSGSALGLSSDCELVIMFTGLEGEKLGKLPEKLLRNLVLLLEHTWESVGYSVRINRSFLAAAVLLARMADSKDNYTHGHSLRVARLSCSIGRELGLPDSCIQTLQVASILHDIGKLAIPGEILNKKGLLTRKEREIIEAHPEEGARVVSGLSGYEEVAGIILSHHERLDGHGYPEGLAGMEIPFLARIVAVADTFDAITSDRSYRSISGWSSALKSIIDDTGTRFDARVVSALENLLSQREAGTV
ncbi:MAG: HD domain-containing protein [Candidatus Aegiribacteria sp.]|nr:HD domain-containing protein [Candidatus Aegiribacteria sp.]